MRILSEKGPAMSLFARSVPWVAAAALLVGCGVGGKPPANVAATVSAPGSPPAAAAAAEPPFGLPETLAIVHVRLGEIRRLPIVRDFEKRFGRTIDDAVRPFLVGDRRQSEYFLEAEKVSIAVDSTPFDTLPCSFCLMFGFAEPRSIAEVRQHVGLQPIEEVEIEGKAAWIERKPDDATIAIAVLQADPRTILVGPEATVRRLAAAKGSSGPVAERLSGLSPTAHLRVAAVAGSWKPKLAEAVAGLIRPPLPPPFDSLPKQAEQLESAAISCDFAGKTLLEISLEPEDEAAAERAAQLLKACWEQVLARLDSAKPKFERVVGDQAWAVVDELRTGVTVGRQGKTAVLRLARPAALDGALDQALQETLPKIEAEQVRVESIDRLRDVGLGMLQFRKRFRGLPSDVRAPDGTRLLSWRVRILPYSEPYREQYALYENFDRKQAWDSPANKPWSDTAQRIFETPGVPPGHTAMFVFRGPQTLYEGEENFDDVIPGSARDGSSNTILLVLAKAEHAVPWAKPSDIDFDPEKIAEALALLPDENVHVAMFDGRVLVWKKRPKAEVMKALVTPAGGEAVDPDEIERK